MTDHSKLSPSSAHRWMNCPGSVRLCADLEETSSVHADEGTFAHNIAALCLEQHIRAVEMVGETDGRFTCDFDMADHLQVYLDVVNDLDGQLLIEKRVHTEHDNVSGTADAIIVGSKTLHVIDLKYGAGVFVEVEENPQLMIYAIGALRECYTVYPRRVAIHVVQPRCSEPMHRPWVVDAGYLLDWNDNTLSGCVESTEEPDALLSAGEHCRFCNAKPTCPALRAVAQARTREVFADKKPPDPRTLTPEQMQEILEAAPLVEMWLKSVREHAHTKLKGGTPVPGFKLVHRKSNREWDDEGLARCAGVPIVSKLMSPAQAEKRIGKEIVAELVAPQTVGTVLVQDSDKRPALSVGSAFETLP